MSYIYRHITIIASPKVATLARTALELQDACNGRAVARTLTEVMDYFCSRECQNSGQELIGTDLANQNPITCAILNKLMDLAKYDSDSQNWECHQHVHSMELYDAVCTLAQGIGIIWPIQVQDDNAVIAVCINCHNDMHREVRNGVGVWVDEHTGSDMCGEVEAGGNVELKPHSAPDGNA